MQLTNLIPGFSDFLNFVVQTCKCDDDLVPLINQELCKYYVM